MTFLTAPPSSQPMTSSLVYGRKYGVAMACCTTVARSSSVQATTAAAGCRKAISPARLGPVTTATRAGSTSATSTITSLIRLPVPSSMPFIRLTSVASGRSRPAATHSARLPRRVCDGTAIATRSAPSSASSGVRGRGDLVGQHAPRAGSPGCAARRRMLVGDLLPPGPHDDVAPGVGEHLRERGAPRAGAEHRDPLDLRNAHDSILRPSRLRRAAARAGLPQRRRGAAPDLGHHVAQHQHDVLGDLREGRRVRGRALPTCSGRAAARRPRSPACAAPAAACVVRGSKSSLRPPHRDRDHRGAGGEPEPGGAGLAAHRPQVGLLGGGALGVDQDTLAGLAARPTAASSAFTASTVPRSTGVCSTACSQRPSTGILNTLALARKTGHRPAS